MLSLRARLFVVALLAAVTVAMVLVLVASNVRSSLGHRLPAARAEVAALADGVARGGDAQRWIGRIDDGALGLCDANGAIFGDASRTPADDDVRARPLPHDQHDAVVRLCRDGGSAELVHPHDIVSIQVVRVPERTAWALVRTAIVEPAAERRWTTQSIVLGGTVLLLIVTAASALVGLGRGVRDLEGGLAALRGDLRAPLPVPAAPELARLTQGLKEMASYLADARDRERSLERDLAHRERLAGLGRVVAGVAHEIRNPLAGIKLKLDVMARDPTTSGPQRAEIATCLEEVERLDRVVHTLLTVARKREVPARREEVDLRALVAQRIALQERGAPAVTFVGELDDAVVLADRDDLTRIVDNLLANAVDAVSGRGRVVVRTGADGVRVSDDGPGVAERIADQLFTPFSSTKDSGLGLGLWLSRSLAESNGGTLDFEGGSTFVLRLGR